MAEIYPGKTETIDKCVGSYVLRNRGVFSRRTYAILHDDQYALFEARFPENQGILFGIDSDAEQADRRLYQRLGGSLDDYIYTREISKFERVLVEA